MNGSRSFSPQEIADALRDRIRTGDLKAGDRLPTQADLAEEFGVERGAVRQALRLLQEAGLLTNVSKGSPPRIAEQSPVPGEPQPTMVALAPRLSEAFAESQVRLDAACLTAESLMLAVGESVRLIHEGRARPKSIDVRVLLPSREITLAFPVPVDGRGEDDPVHQRWLTMRNAQAQVLQHNLLALRATHGIDVHVTFRALPFTPRSSSTSSTARKRCSVTTSSTNGRRSTTARPWRCTTPSAPSPSSSPSCAAPANGTPPSSSNPSSGSTPSGKPSRRT